MSLPAKVIAFRDVAGAPLSEPPRDVMDELAKRGCGLTRAPEYDALVEGIAWVVSEEAVH